MKIKGFITAMLQLLSWATQRQLRRTLNVLGLDMKPEVLNQILSEMVEEKVLCVWRIGNHKYYGLLEENAKKERREENETKNRG